jgi:electron transfer flavoprotein alpha subunit
MSSILVFLQHANGKVTKGSLAAVTAARGLQSAWSAGNIYALVLGVGAKEAAQDALSYGFSEVLFSEQGELENLLPVVSADLIFQVVQDLGAMTVVASSSSVGKDVMPRVAALLEAGQASEVLSINSDGSLTRPMYAGDVIATVVIDSPIKVVTVRQTAFAPAEASPASGSVREFTAVFAALDGTEFVSRQMSGGERPELADAAVVVSGGRALQSAENFEKVIFPLADVLGAAVGASRAAVDSGYAPNDWQVGQTGKVVAPQLYISVGISGAIQHLAGMKDSKIIVAINKDADAPIFEVADYGLVADLYQAVPELIAAIKATKA